MKKNKEKKDSKKEESHEDHEKSETKEEEREEEKRIHVKKKLKPIEDKKSNYEKRPSEKLGKKRSTSDGYMKT